MHSKRKTAKYIILLLALMIIFQLISGAYANTEHTYSHASRSSELLSRWVGQIGITILNKNNRRLSLQFIPVEFDDSSLKHLLTVHSSYSKSLYNSAMADIRENMNTINPHYFHGSRYKEHIVIKNI